MVTGVMSNEQKAISPSALQQNNFRLSKTLSTSPSDREPISKSNTLPLQKADTDSGQFRAKLQEIDLSSHEKTDNKTKIEGEAEVKENPEVNIWKLLGLEEEEVDDTTALSSGILQSEVLAIPNTQASIEIMQKLLKKALWQHPSILSSRAGERAAGDDFNTAKRRFLPEPSITTSRGPKDTFGRQQTTTFQLTQPLWTGGRLVAGYQGAELRQLIAQVTTESTKRELALKFINLYQDWWLNVGRVKIQQITFNRLDKLRLMMERRVSAGVSAPIDLELSSSRLKQAQADLEEAKRAVTTAQKRIDEMSGNSVTLDYINSSIMNKLFREESYDDLSLSTLSQSPDFQRANFSVAVAQTEVDANRATMWPTLSARIARQEGSYLGSLQPDTRLYFDLSYQPGAGFASLSQIDAAKNRVDVAENNIDIVRRDILEKFQLEWQNYFSVTQRLPQLESASDYAEKVMDSYLRLFTNGRRSWLDLINVVRDKAQTDLQLTQNRATLVGSTLRISLLSGLIDTRNLFDDEQNESQETQ